MSSYSGSKIKDSRRRRRGASGCERRWERLQVSVAKAGQVDWKSLNLAVITVEVAPAVLEEPLRLLARPVAGELFEHDEPAAQRLLLCVYTGVIPGELCARLAGLLPI